MFAIKTTTANGNTVGHLPQEISRVSEFLLDRGATITAELTSTHYRHSPLVQGGLEIACKIIVRMPGTVRNHMLIDKYMVLVQGLYTELKNEVIMGSFLTQIHQPLNTVMPAKRKKLVTVRPKDTKRSGNIKIMFQNIQRRNTHEQNENQGSCSKDKIIEIDD